MHFVQYSTRVEKRYIQKRKKVYKGEEKEKNVKQDNKTRTKTSIRYAREKDREKRVCEREINKI